MKIGLRGNFTPSQVFSDYFRGRGEETLRKESRKGNRSPIHKVLDAEAEEMEKRTLASENESPLTLMEQTAEPVSTPSIQDNLHRCYEDGEEYVRQNPTKTALVAMGAGFLLAQLPLRWMFVALIKLLFLVVKPVTFVYAISKLIDDVRAARAE